MTNTPPYQVTDPATGEVTEKFPFATDAEVEQALASATSAFEEWRKRPKVQSRHPNSWPRSRSPFRSPPTSAMRASMTRWPKQPIAWR